jgi:hypothetical protein
MCLLPWSGIGWGQEIDDATLREASDAFAAEVYRVIAPSLESELSKKNLSQEVEDRFVFKTVSFIAECVVSDLSARPTPRSDEFLRSLAAFPPDMPIRETVRLRYGDEDAETLWFNVDYLLDKCTERAYKILGVTK